MQIFLLPERTHDSDVPGEWNKDRNEITEHRNTDSSSTTDHIASDEPGNDLKHADTHESDNSGDTTTMPSLE